MQSLKSDYSQTKEDCLVYLFILKRNKKCGNLAYLMKWSWWMKGSKYPGKFKIISKNNLMTTVAGRRLISNRISESKINKLSYFLFNNWINTASWIPAFASAYGNGRALLLVCENILLPLLITLFPVFYLKSVAGF